MPGYTGRSVTLTWGEAALLGIREKSIALNGEPIDLTSDENEGARTLLEDGTSAEDQVDITLSGVTKSVVLKTDWFAGDRAKEVLITYPDLSTLAGTFVMASYSEGMPYNDAATFELTLRSSGPITFTPYS